MGTLVYEMSCSLDGYVADADGRFDWGTPSDDAHAFINARVRDVGTYVMGRGMYATMRVWDTWPTGQSAVADEFAEIWRAADKIVCSSTLAGVDAPRTTLEPRLTTDRLAAIVGATDGVVEVAGPTTAAGPLRAGMVDELAVRVVPHVAGSGLRLLPDGMQTDLALVAAHPFDDGSVHLLYRRA